VAAAITAAILPWHAGKADVRNSSPSTLYQDLETVSLSVHISGGGDASLSSEELEKSATAFLKERLTQLSIKAESYAALVKQVGAKIPPRTLIVFCNLKVEKWRQNETGDDELIIGNVALQLNRAGTVWRQDALATGLFASRDEKQELHEAVLQAIQIHLDKEFIAPLHQVLGK
jgi:hypothetical protein